MTSGWVLLSPRSMFWVNLGSQSFCPCGFHRDALKGLPEATRGDGALSFPGITRAHTHTGRRLRTRHRKDPWLGFFHLPPPGKLLLTISAHYKDTFPTYFPDGLTGCVDFGCPTPREAPPLGDRGRSLSVRPGPNGRPRMRTAPLPAPTARPRPTPLTRPAGPWNPPKLARFELSRSLAWAPSPREARGRSAGARRPPEPLRPPPPLGRVRAAPPRPVPARARSAECMCVSVCAAEGWAAAAAAAADDAAGPPPEAQGEQGARRHR